MVMPAAAATTTTLADLAVEAHAVGDGLVLVVGAGPEAVLAEAGAVVEALEGAVAAGVDVVYLDTHCWGERGDKKEFSSLIFEGKKPKISVVVFFSFSRYVWCLTLFFFVHLKVGIL